MTPLLICVWVCAVACALTWLLSLVTHEYSWVDRLWSIIPVVYLWIFAGATGFADKRLDMMAGLVTLWGVRLTVNFARKGGYRVGGEDYRWGVLRAGMSRASFAAFNLFFIVIYQNILLLLICLPGWTAFQHQIPLDPLDVLCAVLFLAFLLGETIADQQQWDFHEWKSSEIAAGRSGDPGFLQTGLFRFSRHPNYFFEQAQWWIIFFFGCVAAGSVLQWTVIGPALLSVLFIGSTVFTEKISRTKYPGYADYQRRVSAIIPWFPRGSASRP